MTTPAADGRSIPSPPSRRRPPDPERRSPAAPARANGADRKGTLDGAQLPQNRSAFESERGPEFSSLAVYSGRELVGFVSVIPGMAVAWGADDSPIGTFDTKKAALSAITAFSQASRPCQGR
jgi:hypothetical protein